jgi:acetyl esterase/lipase
MFDDKKFGGKPPFGKPPFDGKPPFGDKPPIDGKFRFSGGKPPMDFMPPLVDVTPVKRKFLDLPYGESPAQKIDLFLPDEGKGLFPVIVYIHGGGFGVGDKRDGHLKEMLDGIKKGYALVSVNYRLSDEAIFPAAVLDCREAVRYIKANAAKYYLDTSRIGAIGGSAGGNLAAMLAVNIPNGEFLGEEGKTFDYSPTVTAAVDMFGPTDFTLINRHAIENGISFTDHDEPYSGESCYCGGVLSTLDPAFVQRANPISYISEKMTPILIEHGTVDKLVPFMQSVIFYDAIKKKLGDKKAIFIPLEGADHEDIKFTLDENMNKVWDFFKENL